MALLDLHQLVDVFNMRRHDAQFLFEHYYPPMSTPHLPSSPTKPRTRISALASSLPVPKTPKSKRIVTVASTPIARGSAVRHRQEGDSNRFDKYDRAEYEDYIREDLNSRVFVDFEVFLKHVLLVPAEWRKTWGQAITAVKADATFRGHHKFYCDMSNEQGGHEIGFYPPLVAMANAVLEVIARSKFGDIPYERRQYYHINHPSRIKGGVMNKKGLSPDLIVLNKERPVPCAEERTHWANPLHVIEVKPYDTAICDGKSIPRLIVDGVDPLANHANPPATPRYRKNLADTATPSTPQAPHAEPKQGPEPTTPSESKKRPAGGPSTSDTRAEKKAKTSTLLRQVLGDSRTNCSTSENAQTNDTDDHSTVPEAEEEDESDQQVDPALQICRYLLEMFSVPVLRSHATVGLVDRDRLQLYHANRSVILVSSAINFSEDEGEDKFIATVIAFHCLSLEQNGILGSQLRGIDNAKLVKGSKFGKDRVVQMQNELHFSNDVDGKELKVTLQEVISREPAMIGRSTVVLNAKPQEGYLKRDTQLVVKVSWPTSGRVPETEFLNEACATAKGEHAWALKHLPRMYCSEDTTFKKGSIPESVAILFDNATLANNKGFVYERRVLRVMVQERLVALRYMSNVKDIGQVFLDVACVHHWLYTIPGILHRDISPNNIMCRYIRKTIGGKKEKIPYGVLMDYDLSSWTKDLKSDYTMTSQQRTGTPPYMAQELLNGTSRTHLYRHDLESLFYVMLLTTTRHTIGVADGMKKERLVMRNSKKLPFQSWFDQIDYEMLGSLKKSFLEDKKSIDLTPDFKDFRRWLRFLQTSFMTGFKKKFPSNGDSDDDEELQLMEADVLDSEPSEFDDETLGGRIQYSTMIRPVPKLPGNLKGLIIRDPKHPRFPKP